MVRPLSAAGVEAITAWRHRPALDGLRAIAALLVLVYHAGLGALDGGYVGVDVFFVLSGFLITSLLTREIASTGRVDVARFLARRVRRLLPAALFVLLVTAAVWRLTSTPMDLVETRGGFIAAALYGSNWWFVAEAQDYFAQDHGASPVLHYWSLSVEEQFYLIWPALLMGIAACQRRFGWRPIALVAALGAASLAASHSASVSEPMVSYFGTHTRAWQPLAGAALALCTMRQRPTPGPASPRSQAVALLGFGALLLASVSLLGLEAPLHRGLLATAGTVALLASLEVAPESAVGRALSWGPLRRLGAWSYSIYLWHWPVVVIVDRAGWLPPVEQGLARLGLITALTLALAVATYTYVEEPARAFSLKGARARLTGAFAGAGLALGAVASLALWVGLAIDDQTADLLERTKLHEQSYRSDGDFLVEGSGPKVLILGDSHVKNWAPGLMKLAEEQDWSLAVRAVNGCPWPVGEWIYYGASECERFMDDGQAFIERVRPDLVLVANRWLISLPVRIDGERVPTDDGRWLAAVERGSRARLEAWKPHTDHVVLIELIPEMLPHGPLPCLSTGAHPADCAMEGGAQPGAEAVEQIWRAIAAADPAVMSVDLDEVVCPDGLCPAAVNEVPTRVDSNHLTMGYSETLDRALDQRLQEQGLFLAEGVVRAPQSVEETARR